VSDAVPSDDGGEIEWDQYCAVSEDGYCDGCGDCCGWEDCPDAEHPEAEVCCAVPEEQEEREDGEEQEGEGTRYVWGSREACGREGGEEVDASSCGCCQFAEGDTLTTSAERCAELGGEMVDDGVCRPGEQVCCERADGRFETIARGECSGQGDFVAVEGVCLCCVIEGQDAAPMTAEHCDEQGGQAADAWIDCESEEVCCSIWDPDAVDPRHERMGAAACDLEGGEVVDASSCDDPEAPADVCCLGWDDETSELYADWSSSEDCYWSGGEEVDGAQCEGDAGGEDELVCCAAEGRQDAWLTREECLWWSGEEVEGARCDEEEVDPDAQPETVCCALWDYDAGEYGWSTLDADACAAQEGEAFDASLCDEEEEDTYVEPEPEGDPEVCCELWDDEAAEYWYSTTSADDCAWSGGANVDSEACICCELWDEDAADWQYRVIDLVMCGWTGGQEVDPWSCP
jgi:hypothetical protein